MIGAAISGRHRHRPYDQVAELRAAHGAGRACLDARAIPVELGRRRIVGGQDDVIVDVALDMLGARAGA